MSDDDASGSKMYWFEMMIQSQLTPVGGLRRED